MAAYDGQREYPAEVLDQRAGECLVAFRARVPSLGFKAFAVRPGQAAAPVSLPSPTTLENRFLRVDLDPKTGSIAAIRDKVLGKDLLRTGETSRFLCACPEVDSAGARAEVRLDRLDALLKRVAVTGTFGACRYRLLLTLEHEARWLEAELEIDYGRGAIFGYKMRPESLLRLAFPFARGTRWINLPFGVYQTTLEHAAALDFCDAVDGGSGVALINDGMPGLHMRNGDVAVLISDGFPPLRGVHRYRFGLYPHAGDWKRGDVLRSAMEFQDRLGVFQFQAPLPLPLERSYLETSSGVILSTIHASGERLRARFYDCTGERRRVRTEWKLPWMNTASERLDGTREQDLPIHGGVIEFDLPAWKIFTIAGTVRAGEQA